MTKVLIEIPEYLLEFASSELSHSNETIQETLSRITISSIKNYKMLSDLKN